MTAQLSFALQYRQSRHVFLEGETGPSRHPGHRFECKSKCKSEDTGALFFALRSYTYSYTLIYAVFSVSVSGVNLLPVSLVMPQNV